MHLVACLQVYLDALSALQDRLPPFPTEIAYAVRDPHKAVHCTHSLMLLCIFHASLVHAWCLRIDGSHPAHVQLKLCQRTRKCRGRMCALPCWDGYCCMVVHMQGYTIILYHTIVLNHHPGLIDCKQVMEEELGRPVRDAFAELSAEPVAAASLGQV